MIKPTSLLLNCSYILSIIALSYITSAAKPDTSFNKAECRNITTQMVVNMTNLEWCGYFPCWSNCYCNITKEVPRTLTTQICEELILVEDDIDTVVDNSEGILRRLSDAELAAIAVIASLVFSIIISLIVFLIQSYHRRRAAENKAHPTVDPESGVSGKDDALDETACNADGANARLLKLQPANREHNVYEDVEAPANLKQEEEATKLLVKSQPEDPDHEQKHSQYQASQTEPLQLDEPASPLPEPVELNEPASQQTEPVPVNEPTSSSEQYTTAAEPADSSQMDDLSLDDITYENLNNPDIRTTNV